MIGTLPPSAHYWLIFPSHVLITLSVWFDLLFLRIWLAFFLLFLLLFLLSFAFHYCFVYCTFSSCVYLLIDLCPCVLRPWLRFNRAAEKKSQRHLLIYIVGLSSSYGLLSVDPSNTRVWLPFPPWVTDLLIQLPTEPKQWLLLPTFFSLLQQSWTLLYSLCFQLQFHPQKFR